MALPQKISQLTEKYSFDDDDYFVVANNGNNYKVSGSTIKDSISSDALAVSTYTIPADTTDYTINLGAYSDGKDYHIQYKASRSSRKRAALWIVKPYSVSSAEISESGLLTIPAGMEETGGFSSVTADVSSNQVRLKITTDNADEYNTSLVLMITEI